MKIIFSCLLLLLCTPSIAQKKPEITPINPGWKFSPLVVYSPYNFRSQVLSSFSAHTIPNMDWYGRMAKKRIWYDERGVIYRSVLAENSDKIIGYRQAGKIKKGIFPIIKDCDSVFWFSFSPYSINDQKIFGVVQNNDISFYDDDGNHYPNLQSLILAHYGSLSAFEDQLVDAYRQEVKYGKNSGYNEFDNAEEAKEFLRNDYVIYSHYRPNDRSGIVDKFTNALIRHGVVNTTQAELINTKLLDENRVVPDAINDSNRIMLAGKDIAPILKPLLDGRQFAQLIAELRRDSVLRENALQWIAPIEYIGTDGKKHYRTEAEQLERAIWILEN